MIDDLLLLVSFHLFQGHLVCECVQVRLAAVKCCSKVLLPFVKIFQLGGRKQRQEVLNLIHSVIKQLVSVSVVDTCKLFSVLVLSEIINNDLSFPKGMKKELRMRQGTGTVLDAGIFL